jgi:mevalonate pyrophosphate decarboxylase
VLIKRWTALETKNINLYSECISNNYPEREKLIKEIEENFKKIDSIKIQPQEPAIYINQNTATVYQDLKILITINGNKQELETREKLILEKTKMGWEITGGISP